MNHLNMHDEVLSESEAAKALLISPRTLQHWRKMGKGPKHIHISNRSIRYFMSDVQEWMRTKTIHGSAGKNE